jgi:hypothetical protein
MHNHKGAGMETQGISEMQKPKRFVKVLRIVAIVIAGVLFAVLFALLFGWLVMLLWNWLMPSIFGLKAITYWEAFGITVLSKILLGGISCGSHGHHAHDKHGGHWRRWITGEEHGSHGRFTREDYGHYRDFWREHGAAAFEEYLRKLRQGEREQSGR